MRAALISIVNQPRDHLVAAPLAVAGRSLARRQLDFARAAACGRIIAIGDGADAEAIALRHTAEKAGLRFDVAADAGSILGLFKANEELLVIAPGLLPESRTALEALSGAPCVLVLPSEMGIVAGFERIDLDRAWAGALLLSGGLVEKIADLPADSDPAAALLRIALQAGLAEKRLPASEVSDGFWTIPRNPAEAEGDWLRRNVARPAKHSVTAMLVHLTLTGRGGKLRDPERLTRITVVSTALIVIAAGAAAWFGLPTVSFFLASIAAYGASLCVGLERMQGAPFYLAKDSEETGKILVILVDLLIVLCGFFAIQGDWTGRLFPPAVLLASLYATSLKDKDNPAALLSDRGLLALLLAVAALMGLAEPAIMLLALGVLGLKAAESLRLRS